MLADPTASSEAKRELARTYNTPGYTDPWECVQDYQRVKRYCADHPQQKSQAVSSALNLPRERIRAWVDSDGKPDAYRGLQTALDNDWIIDDWQSETARALNRLAAWILASGSVNSNWVAAFVAEDEDVKRLREIADSAGISLRQTRNEEGRPTEWIPRKNASVLGRVLHTWTGVEGDKSKHETQFPRYLRFSRQDVAREFAQIYVRLRAVKREDTTDKRIQLVEKRTDRYRESLVNLLKRVVDDEDAVRGDSWPIYIVGEDAIQLLTDGQLN